MLRNQISTILYNIKIVTLHLFCYRSQKSTPHSNQSPQNGNLDNGTRESVTLAGKMKVSDFLSHTLEPHTQQTLRPG